MIYKILFILLLLVSSLSAYHIGYEMYGASSEFARQAKIDYKHHNYDDAITNINQALQEDEKVHNRDNLAYYYCGKGIIYHEQKRYDEAREEYNRVLKLSIRQDDTSDVYQKVVAIHNLACLDADNNDYDKALRGYNMVINQNMTMINKKLFAEIILLAQYNKANLHRHTKEYAKAINTYNTLIDTFSKLTNRQATYLVLRSLYYKSEIYKQQNDLDKALMQYTKAQKILDDQPTKNLTSIKYNMLYQKGLVLMGLDRYEYANKSFDEVIKYSNRKWIKLTSSIYKVQNMLLENDDNILDTIQEYKVAYSDNQNVQKLLSMMEILHYSKSQNVDNMLQEWQKKYKDTSMKLGYIIKIFDRLDKLTNPNQQKVLKLLNN